MLSAKHIDIFCFNYVYTESGTFDTEPVWSESLVLEILGTLHSILDIFTEGLVALGSSKNDKSRP